MGTGFGSPLRVATGGEASWGSKPLAAAPSPVPIYGAGRHMTSGNVASLREQIYLSHPCFISDTSLSLPPERRFAPTSVRFHRNTQGVLTRVSSRATAGMERASSPHKLRPLVPFRVFGVFRGLLSGSGGWARRAATPSGERRCSVVCLGVHGRSVADRGQISGIWFS